jgi:hypothetical protein
MEEANQLRVLLNNLNKSDKDLVELPIRSVDEAPRRIRKCDLDAITAWKQTFDNVKIPFNYKVF